MRRILITGARAPAALDLARSFRAAGCTVTLADSVTAFGAGFSRPRYDRLRLPPPRFAFGSFRTSLLNRIEGYDLVVPTCEEVFFLAEAAARDGWTDRLFAPTIASLRILHSKVEFPGFARENGVDAPRSSPLTMRRDVDRLQDTERLVVKPEFSRFGTRTLVAPSRTRLGSVHPTSATRWVAQERIEGSELSVWSVIRGGRLVACAVYEPLLRQSNSASYAFRAVDRPDVREAVERIGRAVGQDGQLSYDVIVTSDGRVAPVECNPRTVSGVHLFDGGPEIAHAMLGDGALSEPVPGTVRFLGPAMALIGLPAALATGGLSRWMRVWRSGIDVTGRLGDRGPALGVLLDAARFGMLGLGRLRSPTGETTDDIEWNGEVMA
ncbi:ATP-grasp domain-containing protein [Sphingomonas sp. NFX23]|uniref:ATP-grasp domain-containing protein n=1 Tax=Sphingomonas sp. NFX23 TaxID=2819532 RepID=UPI003CEED7BC